jgi:hypothetical protein
VAIVKTEAVCGCDPSPADEPVPHPAMTAKGNNAKRVWTHFNLVISISFFACCNGGGRPTQCPIAPLDVQTPDSRGSCSRQLQKRGFFNFWQFDGKPLDDVIPFTENVLGEPRSEATRNPSFS